MKQTAYMPLAARLRPRTLAQYVGHAEVLGEGTALRRAIENGKVGSLILWGPPGVGKTTLAYIIAAYIEAKVERMSAVAAGVKELREVIARAREWQKINTRTVLIIDEIHRFNKAQQDVLLPAVEEGLVTLIGATTENPYFEVVKALISRVEVVRLKQLSDDDIGHIIDRAIEAAGPVTAGALSALDSVPLPQPAAGPLGIPLGPSLPAVPPTPDKKPGKRVLLNRIKFAKDAHLALIRLAGGDARRALNIVERLMQGGGKKITVADVESAAQATVVQYDKAGDAHYDTISAYIKSVRGSDPDAALFYLFRMLVAGEDPKFIIRRLFIFASEDIGNADPHALMVVAAAAQALEWVGLPEAEFSLAHATIYAAAAPKSNSVYQAMEAAKADVARHGNAVPPDHITNAPIADLKKHGKGVGYHYPHGYPSHIVAEQYRPAVIQGNIYYEPGEEGFEKEVKKRVEWARRILYGKPVS